MRSVLNCSRSSIVTICAAIFFDFDLQQREIKKLEDYIAKNKVRASTAQMAKSREKKLEKMGYVNDGMYGEEFIERYRYVSFSTKFKHFDVFDFTLKVEVVYNSLEEFLKD